MPQPAWLDRSRRATDRLIEADRRFHASLCEIVSEPVPRAISRKLLFREVCGVAGLLLLAGAAFLLWIAFGG
jgi:hypothetical protein